MDYYDEDSVCRPNCTNLFYYYQICVKDCAKTDLPVSYEAVSGVR